jgi:DNA-directed RNA polymerase delta subunit
MDQEKDIQTDESKSSILEKIISIKHKTALQEFEPAKVVRYVLQNLKQKEREVLIKRFGLQGEEKKILEEIGKEYGVSRERIRQIQKLALEKINQPSLKKILQPAIDLLTDTISQGGGIKSEEDIIQKTLNSVKQSKENLNALKLILEIEGKFIKIKQENMKKSWSLLQNPQKLVTPILETFKEILEKAKKTLKSSQILQEFKTQEFYKQNEFILSDDFLLSCLQVSCDIMKTEEGKWGLRTWPDVNPKNIKDKALFILKKHKKPAHFRTIAQMIREANFDQKPVNNQAVHNELVKDKKFVLVGRGIYGLAEWGFKPGTVADVIEEIFKKEGKPLDKDEIVKRVLQVRQVNTNTIILNLQEKPQFIRVKKSTYTLKKEK